MGKAVDQRNVESLLVEEPAKLADPVVIQQLTRIARG